MMLANRRSYSRYVLHPDQREVIDQVARSLPPSRRHSFLLRCSQVLQLSTGLNNFPTDNLVQRSIARAFAETVP